MRRYGRDFGQRQREGFRAAREERRPGYEAHRYDRGFEGRGWSGAGYGDGWYRRGRGAGGRHRGGSSGAYGGGYGEGFAGRADLGYDYGFASRRSAGGSSRRGWGAAADQGAGSGYVGGAGWDEYPAARQPRRVRDTRFGEMGGAFGRPGQRSRGAGFGHGDGAAGATGSAVDSVRAAEIMTPNPEAVTPDTPVADVARRMRDLDVGVIPVVDDPDSFRLRGVVTDRDIAIRGAAEGKDARRTPVREVMTAGPSTVRENDHVRDVFAVMKRARVRRVPVVDEDGRLVGIIAQADLAVNYAGLDLQRETEVEEVIERISEPARPRWGRDTAPVDTRARMLRRLRHDASAIDLPGRVRSGWRTLRREARELMRRGYDHGLR